MGGQADVASGDRTTRVEAGLQHLDRLESEAQRRQRDQPPTDDDHLTPSSAGRLISRSYDNHWEPGGGTLREDYYLVFLTNAGAAADTERDVTQSS